MYKVNGEIEFFLKIAIFVYKNSFMSWPKFGLKTVKFVKNMENLEKIRFFQKYSIFLLMICVFNDKCDNLIPFQYLFATKTQFLIKILILD